MYLPWSFSWARRFGVSVSLLPTRLGLDLPVLFTALRSLGPSRRRDWSMAFIVRRSVAISRETELMEFGIVTPPRKSDPVHGDC